MNVRKSIKYNPFVCLMMAVLLVFCLSPLSVSASDVSLFDGSYIAPTGAGYNYFYTYKAKTNSHVYEIEQWSDFPLFLFITDNPDNKFSFGYQLRSGAWHHASPNYSSDVSWNPFYLRYSVYEISTPHDVTVREDRSLMSPYQLCFEEMLSFSLPFFSSFQAGVNYYENGDDSGLLFRPDVLDNASFDVNIPTPELVFSGDGGYKFKINNASEDLYIQMRGRWYSVDDIESFKENLLWKHKYSTLLKGELSEWISPGSLTLSADDFDLSELGISAWNSFLSDFPIDSRSYSGGTNELGNMLFGYNDALEQLKLLLAANTSAYNSAEIYVRFFTLDESDNARYGRWCHWYNNMASPAGSSGSTLDDPDNVYGESQSKVGLTDDELDNNETKENPRNDLDMESSVNSDYFNDNENLRNGISGFVDAVDSMSEASSSFGGLLSSVFGWMPWWCTATLGAGLVVIVIVRILGR